MKKILASIFLAISAIALTGCQSFVDYVVETGQPEPAEAPHTNACKANVERASDGQSTGFLTVRPGNLCVNVEGQLTGLPPTADLVVSVRRNHARVIERTGEQVDVAGTNFTGYVGSIRTSSAGSVSVKLSTNNVKFSDDTLLGRGLCITDAEGNLIASGVLGISEEH